MDTKLTTFIDVPMLSFWPFWFIVVVSTGISYLVAYMTH